MIGYSKLLHLQSKLCLMKSKIYLFILISLGFAPLKAQKKFSGGAGVSLLASQIDGDQAAGYSKFGGSIEVFTRFSLEKYSLQLRMGLGERGSRRNITKNPGTPMHLRYRTLDVTGGILKPINKKMEVGVSIICARRLSAVDTEGYINYLESDSRKNFILGELTLGYKVDEHLSIRFKGEYSITGIFKNDKRSLRYKTGSYFNVLGIGADYSF